MEGENHQSPGIATLVGRLARTGIGAVQNRFELLSVEWQEERLRLTELLVKAVMLVFLGMMGIMLVTATVIFLFPEEHRAYVAGAFALLYILGAVFAWFSVKSLLKREPFVETIDQAKKDRAWLKSFE